MYKENGLNETVLEASFECVRKNYSQTLRETNKETKSAMKVL